MAKKVFEYWVNKVKSSDISKKNKIKGDYNEYLAMKHFKKLGYIVIKTEFL